MYITVSHMETDRLKHFRVLVETGNMRKAAELLNISHGGLSKSIKKLEEELDVKLVRPEGRGLTITEDGKRVYLRAIDLLKATQTFLGDVKSEMVLRPKSVRIGTFEVFSTYFMGALLAEQKAFAQLEIREYIPGKLEAAICSKEVDFGITYLPIPHSDLIFSKVVTVEMGVFVAKGVFVKADFPDLPFAVPIAPVEGSPSGVKGLDGWPEHLFTRDISFEVDLMESGLELCRRGLCAIFIPNFIAALHNSMMSPKFSLTWLPYPEKLRPVHRDVYLITRKDHVDETAGRKLAKGLRTICRLSSTSV